MTGLPGDLTAALEKAELGRRALFRIYNDLRREARDSEDFELHRLVGEAYQAFMRSWLTDDERRVVDLENEVASLRAELHQWRTGIKRNPA